MIPKEVVDLVGRLIAALERIADALTPNERIIPGGDTPLERIAIALERIADRETTI